MTFLPFLAVRLRLSTALSKFSHFLKIHSGVTTTGGCHHHWRVSPGAVRPLPPLVTPLLCYRRTGTSATDGVTTDGYPFVTFTLHLRREPLYYVVNLIIPCGLLSFIAVCTFILQPSCQHRVGLSK